jgi:hypothetical protein
MINNINEKGNPSMFSHDQVIIRQPDGSYNAYYVPRQVAEYIHHLQNVMDNINYELEKDWWDDE